MAAHLTGHLVHLAHADAWQVQGRLRHADGGATADLPGVRLMSSGLPFTQWNTADVLEPDVVDVRTLADWYAARGVPWGVRVADGSGWPHGRRVARQRLMGQLRDWLRPAASTAGAGAALRRAGPGDLDAVVAVDVAAFDGDPGPARRWLAPMLVDDAVAVVVAEDDTGPVGTAYAVRSDGRAGPAVLLGGVAVVPRARRRGLASAMSSRLLRDAYDDGALLGHLQPDTDAAAAVYARLGFVEVEGVEIRVDVGVVDRPGRGRPGRG